MRRTPLSCRRRTLGRKSLVTTRLQPCSLPVTLADGDFDEVTSTNNHVFDAGSNGVADMNAACIDASLLTVGADAGLGAAESPPIPEPGSVRLGVVACAERECPRPLELRPTK